jgi:hypothetical protein
MMEDMKRLEDNFSKLSQEDMNLLDPDLLLAASSNLSEEETLKMLIDAGSDG